MIDQIKQIQEDIFDPKKYLNIAIISAIIGGSFQAFLLLSIGTFYLRFFSISQMIADTISILLPLLLLFSVISILSRLIFSSFKKQGFWIIITIFISSGILAYHNSPILLLKYIIVGFTILGIIGIISKNKERIIDSKWLIKTIQFIGFIIIMSILLGIYVFFKENQIQKIFISPSNFINQTYICNKYISDKECHIKYFNDKYIFIERENNQIEIIKFDEFFKGLK